MKRISILAFPLILTSFLTVLVSRVIIFFIPEIVALFVASPETFTAWRNMTVSLTLSVPILSGIVVTMLICGLKHGTKPATARKTVIIAVTAIFFVALTVLTAKVNGNAILPLIRTAM